MPNSHLQQTGTQLLSDAKPALVSRRQLGLMAVATFAVAGYASLSYLRPTVPEGVISLSVQDAHAQATGGQIVLIDIRRPDEWNTTGIGEGAHPLDMRRKDFVAELDQLVAGNRTQPVALICARGVRSARMSNRLTKAGFTRIIDVPEGMLGSRAGPGWLGQNLPTRTP
jgi:rhodanese-related sulfurtransferase